MSSQPASGAFAVSAGFDRRLLPQNLARLRVAEMRAGVVESLLNVEDFEAGPRRVEVGKMQRVAVPEAGRVKPFAVVVDHARAVDDLVSVAVHVADAEVVISLPRVAFIAFVRAVESPRASACRRQFHAANAERV